MATRATRRVKRVEIRECGQIEIHFEKQNRAGGWDYHTMRSSEKGRPEFYASVRAISRHALDVMQLPESYLPLDVRSIEFTYSGMYATMGAILTVAKRLRCGNYMSLKAPHRLSQIPDNAKNPIPTLSPDCVDHLTRVMREALRYIDGDREQQLAMFGTEMRAPAMAPPVAALTKNRPHGTAHL